MGHSHPFFSVIVPTYERAHQVTVCLRALACQNYPRDRFEVLVVDDGSTTSPKRSVDAFIGQLNVRLVAQPHSGPAAARNCGARNARGTFLAFTDDDCAPAPSWLQALATRFATAPDCAIGGRTLNALPNNPYSTGSQLLIDYLYTYYNADPDRARFLASNNLALSVERFHAVGGFDALWFRAAAEDREFCDRWLYHGYRLMYAPEVLVHHAHALTFRTFWRQHFNYGRGAFYFHRQRACRGQTHLRMEPPRFYLELLRHPSSRVRGRQTLFLTALVGAAQVANAAGFFWERGANRKKLKSGPHSDEKLGAPGRTYHGR